MILRYSSNVVLLNVLGGRNNTLSHLFEFRRGSQRTTSCRTPQKKHWRPIINSTPQPLDVLCRHCLRVILLPVYTLAVSSKLTPTWCMSTNVHKMFSFHGKRKVQIRHVFGIPIGSLVRSKSFQNSETATAILLQRTRLLVRELTTSVKALQYDLRRSDMAKSGNRKFFFDTLAVVQLLENNGFSGKQAEVIVRVMVNTTNANMDVMYSDMTTKTQQEIMLQKVMSQIAAVKKDMIILEKSEFSALLAENEKIKTELLQLRMQLADVITKVRSDTLLDMNLEKSRIKEMRADHEKKLLETRSAMMEMNAEQDRHVMQSSLKLDTEVAGLKTMLESHKLDTIKYLAGSVFTCLTVVLSFYRIWM